MVRDAGNGETAWVGVQRNDRKPINLPLDFPVSPKQSSVCMCTCGMELYMCMCSSVCACMHCVHVGGGG